jgi:hypothetical protein
MTDVLQETRIPKVLGEPKVDDYASGRRIFE